MRKKKTKFLPIMLAALLMVCNISTNITAFAAVEDGRSGSVLMLEADAPEPDEEGAIQRADEPAAMSAADEIAAGGSEGTVRTLSDVTIKLSDDQLLNEVWEITGAVELDLNGHKVTEAENPTGQFAFSDDTTIGTALIYVADGGSLTVEDSAGDGSIETESQTYVIAAEDGTVTINGGTISDSQTSDRTIWVREGSKLEVNDGAVINAKGASSIGINAVDSTVTINGGTINAEESAAYAMRVSGTELEINDGKFNSVGNGVYIQNSTDDDGEVGYSTATINGGSINVTGGSGTALGVSYGSDVEVNNVTLDSNYFGIGYWGDNDHEETKLTINGGTFKAPQMGTSGYHYSNVHVTINGGYFDAYGGASEEQPAGGFYFPCTGTLDFNGGTLISASDGITIRDGTFNMTGGYIEANGVPDEWPDPDDQTTDNGGGYDGVGILIGQHRVEDDSGYDRELIVNISGGEIYGYSYALLENDYSSYNEHQYEERIHVNISGGIFSSSGALDEHPVDIIDEDKERSEGALDEAHVTGGFFSDHVEESDYIDDGYMCIDGVSVTGQTEKTSGDNYHAVIPDKITDENTTFEIDEDTFTYNGQSQVPVVSNVVIKDESAQNAVRLVADKHYTVSYTLDDTEISEEDVVKVNDYKVVVTGTGKDADCGFDKTGGDHTKQDSLEGSVAKDFSIIYGELEYGDLTVQKVVENKPSGSDIAYDFNLVLVESDSDALDLNDVEISYSIKDSDNKEEKSGTFTFGSAVESSNNAVESSNNAARAASKLFSFQLKDGQYIAFEGIPDDMEYTVTETSESEDYTTSAENESGTIGSEPAVVTFTNTYTEEPDAQSEPGSENPENELVSVSVKIVDRNGRYATGVVFELVDSEGNVIGTYTQGSSDISIEVPAGTYTLNITSRNGYTFNATEYTIEVAKDMDPVVIQATNVKSSSSEKPDEESVSFTVKITDRNGRYATGVVFEITDADGNVVGTYTQGSADISITIPEGTYTLTITSRNGYTFNATEYTIEVAKDMDPVVIQATNVKSSSSGSGSSGSSSSGSVRNVSTNKTGHWVLEGALFTYPNGEHPSNEYLNIDGVIWAFYTNGYAVNKAHTQYYTDEAIAAAGNIPTATGTWDVCGWWFSYDDGTYPHNEWAQLEYNGQTYWYHFDVDGWMDDGWFTEDGTTYYLDPVYDGWRGHMVTGWQFIDGYWYYFESDGALLKSGTTPDGYTVDGNGRWVR